MKFDVAYAWEAIQKHLGKVIVGVLEDAPKRLKTKEAPLV